MNATKAKNGKNSNGRMVTPPGVPPVVQAQAEPPPKPEEPDDPDDPASDDPAEAPTPPPREKPPADAVASALLAEVNKLREENEQLKKDNQALGLGLQRARFKLASIGDTVMSIVNQP